MLRLHCRFLALHQLTASSVEYISKGLEIGRLSLQLTVMNTRRLTQKGGAKLESIGKPTGILQSLGPYITGVEFRFHGPLV